METLELLMPLFLFLSVCILLLLGYPVALSLAGAALLFTGLGFASDTFDSDFLAAFPNRLYGLMTNQTLLAVPLFVFMGVTLERSKVAEKLLDTMSRLFIHLRGGLGIAVIIVGMLLAASTGIVGATVVTMGLLSLPTMLKKGYHSTIATGTICASGTLGQIIPPSIILVLLGDVLSSAYQQAQLEQGIFAPETVSVGDLFIGAIIPGLLLVCAYISYLLLLGHFSPHTMPSAQEHQSSVNDKTLLQRPSLWQIIHALVPPLGLILAVLGSILAGIATPTEAAAVGASGALLLAISQRQLNLATLQDIMQSTARVTSMVFFIFIGATIFSLTFRGFGGEEIISDFLHHLPGGKNTAFLLVMVLMFFLGFILDFIEITFIVVPIVAPILLIMGFDPVWLGIMIAINLQTSFLTPPFGFALFYLRGVAPKSVTTKHIYIGVIPFIIIQLLVLAALAYWPQLATWLPSKIYA